MKKKKNILIIIVLVLSVFVATNATISYVNAQRQIKIEQQKAEEERKAAEAKRKAEEEEKKKYVVGVNHNGKEYSYDAKKIADKLSKYDYTNNGEKIVFLTFDDGASLTNTPKILDILKEEDVKATFFVLGKTVEMGGDKAKEIVRREFEEGHAIANHSYSHDVKKLYPGRKLNLEGFVEDFDQNDKYLKEILGKYFSTRVIRCPGGYMSWRDMKPLNEYLEENNMVSIDWTSLNGDAEGRKKNAAELLNHTKKTSEGKDIVVLLMHDTYTKEETVKALPDIIKYYKDNGYEFKTLV